MASTKHRREIGLRMALGADRGSVLRLVLGDALRTGALGALLGLPAAIALGRVLQTNLYALSPADPATLLAALALPALVVGSAAWLPAWRAVRVDPVAALRVE